MKDHFGKLKITILSCLTFLAVISASRGFCGDLSQRPIMEAKAGYFIFSDSKMRKIYDRGGLDLQLCASYPIRDLGCGLSLHGYGALEYLYSSSKSTNDHQHTSLWAIPVNIGLKPVYALSDDVYYYFAGGPRFIYIHQHNRSDFVPKNKSKAGLGFFLNTGINFALCDRFLLDIFGEYSYAKIHFHGGSSRVYSRSIQTGGIIFGIGLGREF